MMKQEEIKSTVITKAAEDEEFRARLVADPKQVVQELTGVPLPDEITIQVHEESAASFHLVLPPDGQLTEEEMARVFAAGDPGGREDL